SRRIGRRPRGEVRMLGLAAALYVARERRAEHALPGNDPALAAVDRLLTEVALELRGDVATDAVVLTAGVDDLGIAVGGAGPWPSSRDLGPLATEADRQQCVSPRHAVIVGPQNRLAREVGVGPEQTPRSPVHEELVVDLVPRGPA